MAISNAELIQLYSMMGIGKVPLTGGPAGNIKSTIAQTTQIEGCTQVFTPSTGVMNLTSIFISAGQTISNINCISASNPESSGSHLWYALYDDGRGSSTAGQLALLTQTADQTGAAALAASTNLGLLISTPYTTSYSGIYYVAFMCAATGMPSLISGRSPNSSVQISSYSTGAIFAGTAGSALTVLAPNPSGAITATQNFCYMYLS